MFVLRTGGRYSGLIIAFPFEMEGEIDGEYVPSRLRKRSMSSESSTFRVAIL